MHLKAWLVCSKGAMALAVTPDRYATESVYTIASSDLVTAYWPLVQYDPIFYSGLDPKAARVNLVIIRGMQAKFFFVKISSICMQV